MRERPVVEVLDSALAELLRDGEREGRAWADQLQGRSSAPPPVWVPNPLALIRAIRNSIVSFWHHILFGPSRLEQQSARLTTSKSADDPIGERVSLEWGLALGLSVFLTSSSKRLDNKERLSNAIQIYRGALASGTRQREPAKWAAIQTYLGAQLLYAGERYNDVELLERSVVVLREAVDGLATERSLQWASTQALLGQSLQALAERRNSTVLLEEAIAVFRNAVNNVPQEPVPARVLLCTQLGMALHSLGRRQNTTRVLREAVITFRQSLDQASKFDPSIRLVIQSHLGGALLIIGEREGSRTHLKEAIAAYRTVLANHDFFYEGDYGEFVRQQIAYAEGLISKG